MPSRSQEPQFILRVGYRDDVCGDSVLPQIIVNDVTFLDDDLLPLISSRERIGESFLTNNPAETMVCGTEKSRS